MLYVIFIFEMLSPFLSFCFILNDFFIACQVVNAVQ